MARAVWYGIALLGAFAAYEAIKGLQAGGGIEQLNATIPAASSPSSPGTSSVVGPGVSVLGIIPSNWLNALFNEESTLGAPSANNPAPAYGIGSGYAGTTPCPSGSSPGANGSCCWNGGDGLFCGPAFTSIEAANAALSQVLSQANYTPAINYLQQNPGDCAGFFTQLGLAGYVGQPTAGGACGGNRATCFAENVCAGVG
jgi:hypothetical protein